MCLDSTYRNYYFEKDKILESLSGLSLKINALSCCAQKVSIKHPTSPPHITNTSHHNHMHPFTMPCTDPCTAHPAGQPQPQNHPSGTIQNGTTWYCCSGIQCYNLIRPQIGCAEPGLIGWLQGRQPIRTGTSTCVTSDDFIENGLGQGTWDLNNVADRCISLSVFMEGETLILCSCFRGWKCLVVTSYVTNDSWQLCCEQSIDFVMPINILLNGLQIINNKSDCHWLNLFIGAF